MSADSSGEEPTPTGFAGLSSQVSDVGEAIAKASSSAPKTDARRRVSESGSHADHSSFDSVAYDRPVQTGNRSKLGWSIGGLIIVAGIIWVANQPSDNLTSPSAPETLTETMPPPDSVGQTLSLDELRYCLSEDVRMGAAQAVVDNYNSAQVDRFNSMAADYNNRCGEFRYRPSSMSTAQDEVDAHRPELEQEGRDRIAAASQ